MNEKFSFRQRGYDCSVCGNRTMSFGGDPDPTICPSCTKIGTLTKQWDHLVTTITTVEDYGSPNMSSAV